MYLNYFQTQLLKWGVATLLGLIIIGTGVGYYFSHCHGLSCSHSSSGTQGVVATTTSATSSVPMLTIKASNGTTYSIPDVGQAPALEKPTTTLPGPIDIRLPVNVTSPDYITHYNAVVNSANVLEVEMRQNLPVVMYAIQTAAESGDLNAVQKKIDIAQAEIAQANALNATFKQNLALLTGDLNTSVTNQTVVAATEDLVTKGNAYAAAVTQYTAATAQLAQFKVPTPAGFAQMNTAAQTLGPAIEAFAVSLKASGKALGQASSQG